VALVLGTAPGETQTEFCDLPIAPKITSPMPMTVARNASGTATITLTCEPAIRPGQRVALLLKSRPVPADPITATTATLSFQVTGAEQGDYQVRLRCEDAESLSVVDRTAFPPVYDQSQVVTVT
jgi:hypothetical protein